MNDVTETAMRVIQQPGNATVIGTFGHYNFEKDGPIEMQYTDEAPATLAMKSFTIDEWVNILCILQQNLVTGTPATLPENKPRTRNMRMLNETHRGIHARVAGKQVTFEDLVPKDDFQVVKTIYPEDNNPSVARKSLLSSYFIPLIEEPLDHIHDDDGHSVAETKIQKGEGICAIKDLKDDDPVLNSMVMGKRYDTALLMKSFREIAKISLTCKAFYRILKEFMPQLREFRSKRDRFTLQENAGDFRAAVLPQTDGRNNRAFAETPEPLDTVWINHTNYSKFMLVRKCFYSSNGAFPLFVMEMLPMWLFRDAISGFDLNLLVSQKKNSASPTVVFKKSIHRVYGLNCVSRQMYNSIPVPTNSYNNDNRFDLARHGPHMFNLAPSNEYTQRKNLTESIVCGMFVCDPLYISSLAWQTRTPSVVSVPRLEEPPAGEKKRARPINKQSYATYLLPQQLEIKVYYRSGKKPGVMKPRPFYSVVRHGHHKRAGR